MLAYMEIYWSSWYDPLQWNASWPLPLLILLVMMDNTATWATFKIHVVIRCGNLDLMAKFHLAHQSERVAQNTVVRKHAGSLWWQWSSKNCWYASLQCIGVVKHGVPWICGRLYFTNTMVASRNHLCLRAHGQNWGWTCTTSGGSKGHGPLACL